MGRDLEGFGHRAGRYRGAGVLGGAEAERLDQAGLAIRTGARDGLRPLAALLARAQQRRVVRLDPLAALKGRAQPDILGDLAARSAASHPGARLVVLVDLQATLVGRAGDLVTEDPAQSGKAFGDPVQRGAGDEQQAEDGQQHEQQPGHPGGQHAGQRAADTVPDVPARLADHLRARGRARRALGDLEQAGQAEQQRHPAEGRPPGRLIAVRVPQEPPGQQRDQGRGQEGQRAEPAGDHLPNGVPGRVVHPRPQATREHDGQPESEQAQTVPAVVRLEVARAAADRAGGEADGAGDHHPGARDHLADPPDQDHDRIMRTGQGARRPAGPVTRGAAALVAGLAARLGGPFPLGTRLRSAARRTGGPVRRRALATGAGPGRRDAGLLGWFVSDTGRHDYKRSEPAGRGEAPPGACRGERNRVTGGHAPRTVRENWL